MGIGDWGTGTVVRGPESVVRMGFGGSWFLVPGSWFLVHIAGVRFSGSAPLPAGRCPLTSACSLLIAGCTPLAAARAARWPLPACTLLTAACWPLPADTPSPQSSYLNPTP
jgi:hypothetical protein